MNVLRALGIACLIASPLSAQAVSSLNPTVDTSGLQAQITAVQTTANAAVKTVAAVPPDGTGNVALPSAFANTTCSTCTMSSPVFTGSATLNGVGLVTSTDIANEVSARNAAIGAIVFPVNSVNGLTGVVTVPVYTDAMAVAANATAITTVSNLAKSAAADVVQIVNPSSGATIVPNATTTLLFVNNASLLAALTVTFPASPSDGQRFGVFANNTITTIGFTGATSRGALATLAVSGYARFVYSASVGVWFRAG